MFGEFKRLKRCAEDRASEWNLSFDEFVELWREHWRDRRRLKLVLCRNGFKGPWAIGNVRIDTRPNQVKDQHARRRELSRDQYKHQRSTKPGHEDINHRACGIVPATSSRRSLGS